MKKKALITGITGQDGSYLAELLLDKGYEVHGIIRRTSSFNTGRIDHLYKDKHHKDLSFFLHYGDLTDSSNLNRLLEKIQPEEIYNLAAQSHVKVSFEVPEYTAQVDALGTFRFLDAIKETGIKTLLPELLAKYSENKEKLNVETFVGKEGIKTVTSNILKVGKPIYALIGKELIIDLLQYHMPQFIKKRTEQKIPAKMIYAESVRKRKMNIPLTELKYVSNESSSPITIIIYGDNVDILIFSEIPIALQMQNNEILQSFMNYFNLMWAIAKK